MEPPAGLGARPDDSGLDSIQFGEDIQHLIAVPPDNGSSFTALLELPPNQAMDLLHSPDSSLQIRPVFLHEHKAYPLPPQHFSANLTFPTNSGLIERAARFSVFAGETMNNAGNNSPETSSVPSNSSANPEKSVKREPAETELFLNSTPPPPGSDPTAESGRQNQRSAKRKERGKKAKGSAKKSRSTENGQNLPYVHVRARRGQATDSHSLAERARREKINLRMKYLQELVPGCNKISGTALVLDEIINHVQSLQCQVELLSMRLAGVNPRIDFNLDSFMAAECGSLVGNDFPSIAMPMMWPELQVNGSRQQCNPQGQFDGLHQPIWEGEDDNRNFITPENSLLSYDDSTNSASLHLNQLKMEL